MFKLKIVVKNTETLGRRENFYFSDDIKNLFDKLELVFNTSDVAYAVFSMLDGEMLGSKSTKK